MGVIGSGCALGAAYQTFVAHEAYRLSLRGVAIRWHARASAGPAAEVHALDSLWFLYPTRQGPIAQSNATESAVTHNAEREASRGDVPEGLNWTVVIIMLVGVTLMVIGSKVGEPPAGELTGRRQIRIWVLWWVLQRGTMSAILKGVGLACALPGVVELTRAVLGVLSKEDDASTRSLPAVSAPESGTPTEAVVMQPVNAAVHFALSTALRDEPWEDLGFGKRPHSGRVLQRARPQWRQHLEDIALRELVALFTAAHVHAQAIKPTQIPAAVDLILYGENGPLQLWQSFGFTSRNKGFLGLVESIEAYASMSPDSWSIRLVEALDASNIPDTRLRKEILAGAARVAQTTNDMLPLLKSKAG